MDWRAFHAINQFARSTGWLHPFFKVYADFGVGVFVLLLAIAGVLTMRAGDARALARAVWAAIAAVIVLTVNQPIADAVGRARPFVTHPHVLVLVDKSSDPGFMSDHSLVAAATAIGLWFAFRRVGIVAIVAAVVMMFTRVYVGADYPGDVLAGFAFGAVVAGAGVPLADWVLAPLAQWVLQFPLAARFVRTA